MTGVRLQHHHIHHHCCPHSATLSVIWLLTFAQFFHHSVGLFFPIENFFQKLRHPQQYGSSDGGNVTTFQIPMLSLPQTQRRIDVLTSVVSNAVDSPSEGIHADAFQTKLIVPTSTSVTSSISSSSQAPAVRNPATLTLPFTPNLFGMMSYVQAWKDIKRNFKEQERERKAVFHSKESGDLQTRILRTLIQKVVNKYQKRTELLKLQILKRQARLQNFLQLPMVAQVIALEQANSQSESAKGHKDSAGKPIPSILDAFLI